MKDKLLIVGAGGHGKVVANIAIEMNKWKSIAFLEDDSSIKSVMDINIIGKTADVGKYISDYDIFVGIGNNSIREKIQERLEEEGASVPVLVHPKAVIGKQVELGRGTVLMAGVVVNCCTTIGKGSIINTGTTIDHDNLIKDYVHVSPGVNIAGSVEIGKRTWLGVGSSVINNINITKDCIIGAGAVVIKDIKESGIYIGVPARRLYDTPKT